MRIYFLSMNVPEIQTRRGFRLAVVRVDYHLQQHSRQCVGRFNSLENHLRNFSSRAQSWPGCVYYRSENTFSCRGLPGREVVEWLATQLLM